MTASSAGAAAGPNASRVACACIGPASAEITMIVMARFFRVRISVLRVENLGDLAVRFPDIGELAVAEVAVCESELDSGRDRVFDGIRDLRWHRPVAQP